MILVRTVANICAHYRCSPETAQRYIDLRDEGYPQHQALLMAGLADPPDDGPPITSDEVAAANKILGGLADRDAKQELMDEESMGDPDEYDEPYCICSAEHGVEELDSNSCGCCGKDIA